MFCVRVLGWIGYACMLVLRVIVYSVVVVCCKNACISSREFCVHVFGVFVCACMFVPRVIVYEFAFVCCNVASHVTRA